MKLGLAFALLAIGLVIPNAFASTASVVVDNKTYDVTYEATGLTVEGIDADTSSDTLTIFVTSTDVEGSLELSLDRSFFDSKVDDGTDDDFFIVLDGGTEGTFTEEKTDTTRTLTITVPSGTASIDVIGTVFASGEPASTETPSEETPAETPAEEPPVEETPVDETPAEEPTTQCGPGTVLQDGVCVLEQPAEETPAETPSEEPPVEETPVEETPTEQPASQCGPGTVLKDGTCVLDETCGPGTILKDGQCVLAESSAPASSGIPAGQGTQFMVGIIGAFIIAFVIMMILWAIGKAGSRKKN